MCDQVSNRKNREKLRDRSEKFYAHTSYITKRSFLPFIKGHGYKDQSVPWPPPHECVYPKPNMYYALHEDTNPFDRFDTTCEPRKYGDIRPHFEAPTDPHVIRDPYCEVEARRKYLETAPTCFVIFGKPDLNATKLAAMIADSWNCVLISPVSLIQQEIAHGSEKGRILEEILKSGECLGPEIIMNLVQTRLQKRDVFHKGYIVEGLPFILNNIDFDHSSYPDSTISPEEQNWVHDFPKVFGFPFRTVCDATSRVDQDDETLLNDGMEVKPHCESCRVRPNYENSIADQIHDIFTGWRLKPSIIIYAMCPHKDAVKKREFFRLDPVSGDTVDTSLSELSKNFENLFSRDRSATDVNISFELFQELMKEDRMLDEDHRKYLVKRLADMKSNVEFQCNLYKRVAIPAIDKWILLHNPQNVIRVDSRAPVSRMFEIVSVRLRTLPIPRVILPRTLMDAKVELEGESPVSPVAIDEIENRTNEEAFRDLSNIDIVSVLFPWRLSSWKFLCPVELAKGRTTEGISKHALQFMNKIFYLSSPEAAHLFIENPRTFLLPFNPRSTCKIAVFGPNYSGKSELSKQLANIFKGTVIDVSKAENLIGNESIYLTATEKADIIIQSIENVLDEEIDTGLLRDGGYIVNGMYTDIKTWQLVVEESQITFEDVIVLFDEAPYAYLLNKWHSIPKTEDHLHQTFREEDDESGNIYVDSSASNLTIPDVEEEEEEEDDGGFAEYVRHVRQFHSDWEALREEVASVAKNLIECNVSKINNISEYVVPRIQARYADKATIMTDEEKERENELMDYAAMTEDVENIGEDDEDVRRSKFGTVQDNRRLGDTNRYCPVALSKSNILLDAKDDFSALFMDKIYLLCSTKALEEFIDNPRQFSIPFVRPPKTIPPFRISILGLLGSGKSTVSVELSRAYGLAHIDYFNCFTSYMSDRGMLPISRNDVIVSPEVVLEDVQLPDDLHDEKYNSDPGTIQTFVRRYWHNGGLLPEQMLQNCLLKFFKKPYRQCGIVFDNFPSCSADLVTAREHYALPEVIIELQCSRNVLLGRMMPLLLEYWSAKQEKEKRLENERYTEEMEVYLENREIWIDRMVKKRRKERRMQRAAAFEDESSTTLTEYEDQSFHDETSSDDDSAEADLDRMEFEDTWKAEHPEPVLFTDWEDIEIAKERISQGCVEMYDHDELRLDATRSAFSEKSIPWIRIDAENSVSQVLMEIMQILDPYVCRNKSVLEKTYPIDIETAEKLLDCGYYFLSSFGRWCPVQLYENKLPLQMFLPLEAQQEIYPVLHRQYIYFLGGRDALAAFLRNPLKYLQQDSCAPLIPLRISIIGPPKCGKTTLAQRFAETYGMKVITRGKAVRQILKNYPWIESAQVAELNLRAGDIVPIESLARCVEMYSIDPSSTSQGFILDGFPQNRKEYEELTVLGLQPMIVFDLKANCEFCLECLSNVANGTKKPPIFSPSYLKHRYTMWEADEREFRDWLRKFAQNKIDIDATKTIWYVWKSANDEVLSRLSRIKSYFRESDYDKVHSLNSLCVSPYEFRKRQSKYEFFCPLCLFHDKTMKAPDPGQRGKGLFQFREYFYWICPQHVKQFVMNPLRHLPPTNTASLPEERPRILMETVDIDHSCWRRRLQSGGFCLVTYVENIPKRKLVAGKPDLGVIHRDNVYLFCSEDCRDKFLTQYEKYESVSIRFPRTLSPVDVKNLPDLGFLEQTVAKLIVEGVNQVGILRPKIPGLSPSISAAIYLGIYLKVLNVSYTLKEVEIYKTVSKRMASRDQIIKVATRTMKAKLNPYVNPPRYRSHKLIADMSLMSAISSRIINNIKFRRTSPTQNLCDSDEHSD